MSLSTVAAASPGNEDNVTFCHSTNSATNPYVVITTDPEAIIRMGHDIHEGPIFSEGMKDAGATWGDIIPPFSFVNGRGETQSYTGMNWPAGQSIVNNGCAVPGVGTTTTTKTTTTTTVPTTTTTTVPTTTTTTVPTTTTTTTVPTTTTTTVPTTTTTTTGGTPGVGGSAPPGQGATGNGNPGGPVFGAGPGAEFGEGQLAFTGAAGRMLGLVGLLLLLAGIAVIAMRTRVLRRHPAPSDD